MEGKIFKEYNNIRVMNSNVIKRYQKNGYTNPEVKWTASIKIDGSQFSVYIYPDGAVKYARRSDFLAPGESFMGYEKAMKGDNVVEKANKIRENLIAKGLIDKEKSILAICGELFGGVYHHPNVKPEPGVKGIQKRISYCPGIHFYCFDIMHIKPTNVLNDNDNNPVEDQPKESNGVEIEYIDDDIVTEVCHDADLMCHYVLHTGTFEECMNIPNDIPDPIGEKYFGLPPIEHNIVEGIVIKPVHNMWETLADGSFDYESRVIIKNKNEVFAEKMGLKESKVKAVNTKALNTVNPLAQLTEKEKEYYDIVWEYVTDSRICSVVSKIGEVSKQQEGKVRNLFFRDVMDDFNKDHKKETSKLEKSIFQISKIWPIFGEAIKPWFSEHFDKFLQGE